MFGSRSLLIFSSFTFFTFFTIANAQENGNGQELDKYSQEALQKTQKLLQDPNARNQAIKGDAKATDADKNLQNVMGSPELTEQAYGLAADILKNEANKNGGDVQRMTDSVNNASQNPADWANNLSPEQIQKIKDLAKQVEANQQQMIQQTQK